jgi:ABC-type polysaccharide/polyol phosphate transport system ATPase subunit
MNTSLAIDDTVISVRGLGKCYKVYDRPTDLLREIVLRRHRHREHWAVSDVSFDVNRGEVVGVVGRNGAGKSTLLKMIAGTLTPTKGSISINGKLSALLELGTGFNDEYSGRENIFFGGLCAGMSKDEIKAKQNWIIDFSELGSVIDQPLRTYSSGMKARLMFSTAIAVDPDVFIVDEALAAGDAAFVAKCLRRMTEICASGSTVFFVSHSSDLVRRLCRRALYFKNGRLFADGDAETVTSMFDVDTLHLASESIKTQGRGSKAGNGPAEIISVTVRDDTQQQRNAFFQHETIDLCMVIHCKEAVSNPAVWIKLQRSDGVLASTWLSHEPEMIDIGLLDAGSHEIILRIDDVLLGDGHYDLTVALFKARNQLSETVIYVDPMSIWERTTQLAIQRRTRPLATIFDQPMRVKEVRRISCQA